MSAPDDDQTDHMMLIQRANRQQNTEEGTVVKPKVNTKDS